MIKYNLSPLDYILAKNEFIKDHGGIFIKRQSEVRLQYLTTDEDGSTYFQVYLGNQLVVPEWILDKQDLSRLTAIRMTHNKRTLSSAELVGMLSSKIGISLVKDDIESIVKDQGGWIITISPDSIRFDGSFKITKSL